MSTAALRPPFDPRFSLLFEALHQLVPDLEEFRIGSHAADLECPEFILSIIGRRARFRRIGLTQLRARTGNDFAADPYIEGLLWFDVGLCQIVSYQDEFVHLDLRKVGLHKADLVYRIVFSLLDDLIADERVLVTDPLRINRRRK